MPFAWDKVRKWVPIMYLIHHKLSTGGLEKYLHRTKEISSLTNWKYCMYVPCTMYFVYDLLERHYFLFLLANSESSSHESLTRESNSDDFHNFPPLPPVEISSLELPPKKHTDTHQTNNTELRSGVTALQLQLNLSEEKTNGIHPIHGVNGMINSKPNGDKSIPPPAVLLSPAKEPPPVLAKPKLWVFFDWFFFCFL